MQMLCHRARRQFARLCAIWVQSLKVDDTLLPVSRIHAAFSRYLNPGRCLFPVLVDAKTGVRMAAVQNLIEERIDGDVAKAMLGQSPQCI
ncbi:MAG TPA: hypothetical protein VLA45_13675, partial [Paracoccaceae bacterium]|nr:hypothetical protein [Paracoccaceae bacterium]